MAITSVVAWIDEGAITQYVVSDQTGDTTILIADWETYQDGGASTALMIELNTWFSEGNEPSIYIVGGGGTVISDPNIGQTDTDTTDDNNDLYMPNLALPTSGTTSDGGIDYVVLAHDSAVTTQIGDDSDRVITQIAVKITTAFDAGTLSLGDSGDLSKHNGASGPITLSSYAVGDVIMYFPYTVLTGVETVIATLSASGATTGTLTVFVHNSV